MRWLVPIEWACQEECAENSQSERLMALVDPLMRTYLMDCICLVKGLKPTAFHQLAKKGEFICLTLSEMKEAEMLFTSGLSAGGSDVAVEV